ncbi:diadenylate cyclase CdaA [Geobacter sp. DSM 9736]|uniref:diadenylate cyclase CdaA n=1 Tax=Geobacter sp. DSM 9736 TaxID=1277350 RepID=UPI000B50DD57|nr:diadenylate cyclase CdaA [Geobacter sp. DSM 9736]SNB45145.1 TIGR00159 family protein [Geobacter sp. DSM 9736]
MTEILQNSGWLFDLLDVAVVAFLIYKFLLLIRGTVTFRLVLVLGLLFTLYASSQITGLKTLGWLLNNLFSSVILVLVIIFQHDLRRALVTISRKQSNRGGDEGGEVIEQLVNAAQALSDKKIGGLMVLEREMPLDGFLEVGTEIDAKVTSEIITSIFLPYSPIHDGAVIIQKGKLTKAGCFLPLTQNPEISKTLGTRHRAAIGLTEIVDAVVIVVSEETGKISVAIGGGVLRDLEPPRLRKVLRQLLEGRWLK